MSNKRNIKAPKSKETKKQQYPASIPANFWSTRKPPSAPVIKPLPSNEKNILPKIKNLPPANKDTNGMDQARTGGSFSLNSRHPMSLPVKSAGFVIGPNYGKPSKFVNSNNDDNENKNNNENDASSLEKSNAKLKVGSFTIMSIMGGSLKAIPDNENDYNKNDFSRKSVDTLMTNLELNNNENNNNNDNNDIDNNVDKDGDDDLVHGDLDDDDEDSDDDD